MKRRASVPPAGQPFLGLRKTDEWERWREGEFRHYRALPYRRFSPGSRRRATAPPSSCDVPALRVRARCDGPGGDLRDGVARVAASGKEAEPIKKTQAKTRVDNYARITEKIVADLAKGVRSWVQSWSAAKRADCVSRPLRDYGQPYSGTNVLLLWSEAVARGFQSSVWIIFKQALELGGAVRKGETGTIVVFASRFTKPDVDRSADEPAREIPFLRAYTVFNMKQIDDLPDRNFGADAPPRDPHKSIAHADAFFANTGAIARHGGVKANYFPASDHVQMPPFAAVRDAASYPAVLSHELVHWTAAP